MTREILHDQRFVAEVNLVAVFQRDVFRLAFFRHQELIDPLFKLSRFRILRIRRSHDIVNQFEINVLRGERRQVFFTDIHLLEMMVAVCVVGMKMGIDDDKLFCSQLRNIVLDIE